MYLNKLYEYALRKNLLQDPDFDEKGRVSWVVRVGRNGEFLNLEQVDSTKEMTVPRQLAHNNSISALFLVDISRYVLGVGPDTKGRNPQCAAAFLSRTREVADATQDEGVRAVVRFLENHVEDALRRRPREQWTGSETLAFCYSPDDKILVHQRPKVVAYWRAVRSESDGTKATCLVTGRSCVPVSLHGGVFFRGSLARMVSFNLGASESHNLEKHNLAPMSREAAEGYVAALRYMLDRAPGSKSRYRQGIELGTTAVLFWTNNDHPLEDLLKQAVSPADDEAELVGQALFKGDTALQTFGDTPFYALAIDSNQSRIVVRDWFEDTAGSVLRNLQAFYRDLQYLSPDPTPISLGRLVSALGIAEGRQRQLYGDLLRSALRGSPLPPSLLYLALHAYAKPPRSGDIPQAVSSRRRVLCRILKMILMRPPYNLEIPVLLQLDRKDKPYLLGRLLCVLDHLHKAANHAGVTPLRDRYLAITRMTASIFSDLCANKSRNVTRSQRHDLDKMYRQITDQIEGDYPLSLSKVEAAAFWLGYDQQDNFFYLPKEARQAHLIAAGINVNVKEPEKD